MKAYFILLLSLAVLGIASKTHAVEKTHALQEDLKKISKAPKLMAASEAEKAADIELIKQAIPGSADRLAKAKPTPATDVIKETVEEVKEKVEKHSDPSHHVRTDAVPAETALQWLKNGNNRYIKKFWRADGKDQKTRDKLVGGQHPHTIVLSCSDSRAPTEMIFDQALGEIFVIRVAGEALDSSVIASVEYAVEHIGSQLLVVMGHSYCGAVKTALGVKEGDSAGSDYLDKLLSDIRPRLKSVMSEPRSVGLEVESALNADGVARDLKKRSEIIRKKVEEGHLTIKSALYRIDTGRVSFY